MIVRTEVRLERAALVRLLRAGEGLFLLIGVLALGYVSYSYLEAGFYQAWEGARFQKTVASAPHTGEISYLKPLVSTGMIVRKGAPLSRIEIPRIGISALVVEGVGNRELKLAVGHIPGTALPGEMGNVGIAGHRDTFFRRLGSIRTGDTVTLTTVSGSFRYAVERAQVVGPASVEVLRPSSKPLLTLVTCYPFYYVGPAPERFVVQARRSD